MAPASTLEHAPRISAALAWAMLLLVASLGSLTQGSLHDGSFATAAGVADAAAIAHRAVCAAPAEQVQASSDNPVFAIAAADASATVRSGVTVSAAHFNSPRPLQRYFSAQPRAPPAT